LAGGSSFLLWISITGCIGTTNCAEENEIALPFSNAFCLVDQLLVAKSYIDLFSPVHFCTVLLLLPLDRQLQVPTRMSRRWASKTGAEDTEKAQAVMKGTTKASGGSCIAYCWYRMRYVIDASTR
jgi:hypothetical protein